MDSNGAFQLAAFTLPNHVMEHCSEQLSDTEALIYGGKGTGNVYSMDFANNGAVTTRAPMVQAGVILHHPSCGSYRDATRDLFVIYAGGGSAG